MQSPVTVARCHAVVRHNRLVFGRCAPCAVRHTEASPTGKEENCVTQVHLKLLSLFHPFTHFVTDLLHSWLQVFHAAQLDVRRSRRFPALVPMHNLRTILATADAEGLAERVSRALQDRLHKAHNSLWRHDTWQQLPPAASMTICRADGASIRAALRPQPVVPRLVQQLQQTGWPQCQLPGSLQQVIPPDCSSTSSRADPLLDSQPGLLQVLHLCQHRMHLLHTQQLPQLQHLRGACTPVPGLDKTQGAAAASKKAAGCWRPNMTAVQAAAAKLPTEDVVRCVCVCDVATMYLLLLMSLVKGKV